MKRKDGFRKLLALLLVLSMILGDSSVMGLADEVGSVKQEEAAGSGDEAAAEKAAETEAAAEKAAETEAAAEKATETEAAAEKAAETEAAAEKATETEAATEKAAETEAATEKAAETEAATEKATETEAATEKETETEAATEKATETEAATEKAAETESETEKATETGTESEEDTEAGTETETEAETETETVFRYSDSDVAVEATVPEEAGVPEDAVLKVEYLDPVSCDYEDAADALDEQLADALGVSGDENLAVDYFLYDVYFEADGGRVEPAGGSVKVTMAFREEQLSTLAAEYEDAEFIHAEAIHLKNDGEAEIVTDYVNTDGNGAVASLGFTLGSFSVMGAAVVYRVSGSAGVETTGDALELKDYVTGITVTYSTDGGTNWNTYTGSDGETIPADAEIKLTIQYGNGDNKISLDDIINNNYTLTLTLPDFFKNILAGGTVTAGNEDIGTITVENGEAVITLYESWVAGKKTSNPDYTLSGDFWVQGEVDIKSIKDPGPDEYKSGNVTTNFNFGGDVVAKYGDVQIDKTEAAMVTDEDGTPYLKYEVTVTAGNDGVMPGVVVKDVLNDNESVVDYVGVTETAASLAGTENGKNPVETITDGDSTHSASGTISGTTTGATKGFTWTIGDMQPNEVRTLVYYVEMKPDYIGGSVKDALTNTATVYTTLSDDSTYVRDSDTKEFTPEAGVTLTKKSSVLQKETDAAGESTGNYLITYTVTVNANEDNSYDLENLVLKDVISTAGDAGLGEDDFELVEDSLELESTDTTHKLTVADSPSEGGLFDVTIEKLEKNGTLTFTYQIRIKAEAIAKIGNNSDKSEKLRNAVSVYYSDDETTPAGRTYVDTTLQARKWTRKLPVAENISEEKEVSISGGTRYYDAAEGSTVSVTPAADTFTVPKGAAQYKVLVNEEGDWNVSGTTFTDKLTNGTSLSDLVHYSGWLKLTTYAKEKVEGVSSVSTADSAAIAAISALTPDAIIWIYVDNLNTFNFKPEEL